MTKKNTAVSAKLHEKHSEATHLRALSHDLSNALEAILQASYLLGQARLGANNRRWVHLIEKSSQRAATINGELRKVLRSLGEG